MSDGYALTLIVMACLMFGKLCGIRNQMKRIADFCERNERKADNP